MTNDIIEFIEPEGDMLTGVPWMASSMRGLKVQLDKSKNSVTLTKKDAKQSYILSGCRTSEFNQLKPESGLAIDAGTTLSLMTISTMTGDLKASLRLLEYDAARERIGTQNFPINSFDTYTPSQGTYFVIFALRLEGVGSLSLSKLRCRPTGQAVPAPAQAAQPAPAAQPAQPVPTPVNQPDLSESQRIQGLIMSVQNEINRTITKLESGAGNAANQAALTTANSKIEELSVDLERASKDAYKWRRRAVGWETKAKEETDGNTRKTAFSHDALCQMAENLPVSNGSRYYDKYPYKVAVVTDIYMYNFYKDTFETVTYLTPTNHQEELAKTDFDLFIYVTCWKGISNDEWRGVKFREGPMNAMTNILAHCKDRNIPTVFQSIEDPSNFEYFLPIATQFDVVLTSDADMIESYKVECGHERVFYGEYGANPILNNPIASMRPALNSAFFAGSYPERYAERCQDMRTMFDSIQDHDGTLMIADRNYGAGDFQFPEAYRGGILPPLEHGLLQRVHKLFRYNLNFNSIKGSPTMCAMRVYELQAQGRALLSNYAKSVFNKFPEVRIVPHPEDMSSYFAQPETLDEQSTNMACVRNIMSGRTSFDVIGTLLENLGLEAHNPRPTGVLVISETETGTGAACFNSQSYENKVMLARNDVPEGEQWEQFQREHGIGYVTVFAEDQDYEAHYLEDMVNGFKYTDCAYVTKDAWFDGDELVAGKSHEYTNVMPTNWRTVFSVQDFTGQDVLAMTGPTVIENGYCVDPFQLNYRRHCEAQVQDALVSPRLSVIVPVYNNGRFLLTKCIPSLQRNALWPEMEILLVDDGSTEDETIDIIEELAKRHSNIVLYRYKRGGSGSASRPRNKGLRMAKADLITFLDPDNEISSGGYDHLVELFDEVHATDDKLGFVSGYQVKVNETTKPIGRHTDKRISKVDDLNAHFFGRNKFPVISTQCAVMHRRLFEDNKLGFVEKAAGQDTLFGWELVAFAGVGAFTGGAHLIYYAEREGSVTNAVDPEYFKKKVIMEKAQVKALKTHGILETFIDAQLDFFIREWYLKKLELVEDEQRAECEGMLADIIRMYGADPAVYGLGEDAPETAAQTEKAMNE